LNCCKHDVLDVQLRAEHVDELGLGDEAELDEALAEEHLAAPLLREPLLKLLRRDEPLVNQNLADALLLLQVDLLAHGREVFVRYELELDKRSA